MQSNSSPEIKLNNRLSPTSSGRILYHVSCKVCHDHSSGKHYGIYACDGCAGFFKRSIRRNRQYVCKSQKPGLCVVDKTHRNQCRSCRLQRCIDVGMNKDAVQHERGPRNSTIRRNLSIYKDNLLGDVQVLPSDVMMNPGMISTPVGLSSVVLDLSIQRFATQNVYSPGYINLMASRILPPTPPLLAIEHIKEMAAEHLFKNVNWIKNSINFKLFSISDQLTIIENSWKDLFIISMAQNLSNINFSHLLYAYEAENNNQENIKIITKEIILFQEFVNQFVLHRIDNNEFELLKQVVLFNIHCKSLENTEILKLYYEDSKTNLSNYMKTNYSTNPCKFESTMNILAEMNQISSFTLEEIFFRKTIGDVTIVRLISDMFLKNVV